MKKIDEFLSDLRHLEVELWADGDHLCYKANKENLTQALRQEIKTRKTEILTFLKRVNISSSSILPILPTPRDKSLPLSFAQTRLWLLDQWETSNSTYNLPVAYRLTGTLNIAALEQSLNQIVQRHETLRTTFTLVDGQPSQFIAFSIAVTLPIIDLREYPKIEREGIAEQIATSEAQKPFDLRTEPLFRAKLLRLAETEYLLVLNMHHIISDRWSFNVFYRELEALYTGFSTDKPCPLPKLPIQYADFAHWQRKWLQSDIRESQLSYWKQKLSGNVPKLQLPTDRSTASTYQGVRQSLVLCKSLTQALNSLTQKEKVTLFITLLTTFNILLHKYTEQEDILLCSPIACRNRVEIEGLIGYFNNIVPMRTTLSSNPTFIELLGRVRQMVLEGYQNQDIPFSMLVELPNLVCIPLCRGMFALQNSSNRTLDLEGITVTRLNVHNGTSNFDLSLLIEDKGETLIAVLEYKTDLFNADTISQMLNNFQALLESLVANPEQRLSDLPSFKKTEFHQLFDKNSEPNPIKRQSQKIFVAPRNQLELQLSKIWESILCIQPIGVRDNFGDLGGHSLLAIRLVTEIEKEFGRKLPLSAVFELPTIEAFATVINDKYYQGRCLLPIQATGSKPPLFLCQGYDIYRLLSQYLGVSQPVYGLSIEMIDETDSFLYRVEDLAAHYIQEIKSIQPEGPYLLGGISFGGIVALEVAQQLIEQKEKVAFLGLFDTPSPNAYQPYSLPKKLIGHLTHFRNLQFPYLVSKLIKFSQQLQWFKYQLSKLFKYEMTQENRYSTVDKIYKDAASQYKVKTYFGKITLFKAMEENPLNDVLFDQKLGVVEPSLGWQQFSTQEIDIQEVSGGHISMIKEPHVQVLAKKLRICLDKSLRG